MRTNILLIHTDQHRADCLGVAGNPDIQTPNIDALAAEGVHYTNHFCTYPVCTPSRTSLLTGLYCHQHGVLGNSGTLAPGLATFPRILRDAGYRTTAIGKMHFNPTYLDVGFDRMLLAEQCGPGHLDDDYHRGLMAEDLWDVEDTQDQVFEYRQHASAGYWQSTGAIESSLDEAHSATTWIGDRAVEELGDWGQDGNLLMVGFIKPHHPHDPPAPWSSMYDPQALTLLPGWTEECLPRDIENSR
ncbi:MAG: sulfatase-like hydrolase/transferase, partial [Propionibacteriaceae bacterium]|nr:sulfatase-like hydrolase/transferase [Propionibacteriaceae bacterium]